MFLICALATVVLGLAVHRLIGVERTIIVPPEINKTFWVDNEKVSSEYLEEMAMHIAQMELTVTPESFRYQADHIIKYAYPSATGDLRSSFDARETQLRRDQISSWFAPTEVTPDEKKLQVRITGKLTTYIGKEQIPPVEKTYLVEFVYSNSKLYLKTFNELVDEKVKKVAGSATPGNTPPMPPTDAIN